MHGPQTAVVVGKGGEEIDTDKYGCVKVLFHWDRVGKKDENASCWVRVAQSLAGKTWGAIWLPRMGQEVVVEFLEGNPDRPLVTGTVYNEDLLPPYDLPANKTQSGWKMRSTKEGKPDHFNELRFENKKDSEHIYLHAERNLNTVVEADQTLTVGGDGEGSRTVEIEKDCSTTVNTGNRTAKVKEGDESLTVAQGDRSTVIGTGDDSLSVEGDRTVVIESGNHKVKVRLGDETISIDKGNRTVHLGLGNQETKIDLGNRTVHLGLGNQETKVDLGKSTTEAMQSIELKVGQSSVKIDQMGVTIKGMMVKVEGTIMTEVKGVITKVNGEAVMKAGGGVTMLG